MAHVWFLITPLVLSAVLSASAIAKVRDPHSAREAFVSLRLPRWLADSGAPQVLPWAEGALAFGLLVAPGKFGIGLAAAAAALMVAYLILILRALTFREPVTCGCFGTLGLGDVTRLTACRNLILVMMSALVVAGAVQDQRSPAQRWLAATSGDVAWLLACALMVVLTWFVVGGAGRGGSPARPSAEGMGDDAHHELEYLRAPTPYVALKSATGADVSLRELARRQAQLIIFINSSCGSCRAIIAQVPEWSHVMEPSVAVRALFVAPGPEALRSDPEVALLLEKAVFDPDGALPRLLGIGGTPAAVLVGTDDLLAGGPVTGSDAVNAFVAEIRAELEAANLVPAHDET